MRMIGLCAVLSVSIVAPADAKAGETHEVVRVQNSSYTTGDAGTGSSHDQDAIIERVIQRTDAGVEVEYDFPKSTTKEERAGAWQLPARILKRPDGSMQLLNAGELQARVDRWLKSAHLNREACGHLIFTWNAFRIECDPQSVIRMAQAFDLGGPQVHDGARYRDPAALQPAALVRKSAASGRATYSVVLPIDPEQVRNEEVETDLGVAEITRKKLSVQTPFAITRTSRFPERLRSTSTPTQREKFGGERE